MASNPSHVLQLNFVQQSAVMMSPPLLPFKSTLFPRIRGIIIAIRGTILVLSIMRDDPTSILSSKDYLRNLHTGGSGINIVLRVRNT